LLDPEAYISQLIQSELGAASTQDPKWRSLLPPEAAEPVEIEKISDLFFIRQD
jgi:hypothetical protein